MHNMRKYKTILVCELYVLLLCLLCCLLYTILLYLLLCKLASNIVNNTEQVLYIFYVLYIL